MNYPFYYIVGLLLAKGNIFRHKYDNLYDFFFEIRFNKPRISSTRSDNIHRKELSENEELFDFILPDIIRITSLFKNTFDKNQVILEHIPEPNDNDDFSRKTLRWIIKKVSFDDPFIIEFWNHNDSIDLTEIPYKLDLLHKKAFSKSFTNIEKDQIIDFLIGISDAAAIIPGTESSSFGKNGKPRIQIEVDLDRWKLNILISTFLQKVANVPVLNINWPHPTIKGREKPMSVLKHNHQFRADLWYFQNVGFNLSIKSKFFQDFITKMKSDKNFKIPKLIFHPNNRKQTRYVSKEYYLSQYPSNIQGITTNPFNCNLHNENSNTLPKEIRGKHYAEWRDINFDLGDPELNEYSSNKSKGTK
jgi:hypothetical protein